MPRPFGSLAKSPLPNLCRAPRPRSQALPRHPRHQACRGRASPPGAPHPTPVMSGGGRAGGCWVPGAVWQLKVIKVVCTALQAEGNAAMHERSVWPKGGHETEQGPRPAGCQGENPRAAVTGQQGQGGAARTAGVWWAQAGACICPQFWGSQGHGPQGELALVGGLGSRG